MGRLAIKRVYAGRDERFNHGRVPADCLTGKHADRTAGAGLIRTALNGTREDLSVRKFAGSSPGAKVTSGLQLRP